MKSAEFIKEVKALDIESLYARADEIKEELMKLRFRKVSGQLEQSHHFGVLKKNLARVKTIISEKNRETKE